MPRGGTTLLPDYRLVAYYGAPASEALGALGIGSPDEAVSELEAQAKLVHDTAAQVFKEKGVTVEYLVGTMIELPRACIVADQIAAVLRMAADAGELAQDEEEGKRQ